MLAYLQEGNEMSVINLVLLVLARHQDGKRAVQLVLLVLAILVVTKGISHAHLLAQCGRGGPLTVWPPALPEARNRLQDGRIEMEVSLVVTCCAEDSCIHVHGCASVDEETAHSQLLCDLPHLLFLRACLILTCSLSVDFC